MCVRTGLCRFLCQALFLFVALKHYFITHILSFGGPSHRKARKDKEMKFQKCILKKDADPALIPSSQLHNIEAFAGFGSKLFWWLKARCIEGIL